MRKLLNNLWQITLQHPISIFSYLFLIACWYEVISMFYSLRIWSEIRKEGYDCINGQAYGFILASLLFIAIFLLNILQVVFRKDKKFYIGMVYLLLATSIVIFVVFKSAC